MRGWWAIAAREWASFFRLPVGWIAVALYVFLTGAVFALVTLVPGGPASLRDVFGISGWLLLPVAPAISMRLLSEESRSGTLESLLTAPVSDAAVVLGKFVGACLFMGAMLLPTLVYPAVLFAVSDPAPDPGPILAGYLSLVLVGALFLAVGTLFSALSSNQTLAFLGTFLFLLAMLIAPGMVLERVRMGEEWAAGVRALSIGTRLGDFAKGVVDTGHIVFFLSGAAWFLVLATVAVQSRRWR